MSYLAWDAVHAVRKLAALGSSRVSPAVCVQSARWLENPGPKKYLFAFSRGSRNCLGMMQVSDRHVRGSGSLESY
jgi:hypothetical protein